MLDDDGEITTKSSQQESIYTPQFMISPMALHNELQSCSTLDELKALCEKHRDILKTDLENTNLVFGVGNPHAKLMIVGEAPGENEDIQGEPFVGKAGQLLDKIMQAIEFERKDIYIANILKHRPPKNRDPLPDERERSLPFLIRQIEIIQPKIVLCMGRISAKTLLGLPENTTLAQLRGQFHPFLGKIELTATYHPAALLRNPNWKRPTWEDVQMVRKRYDELVK
ncbi:uracil-DNA glycosylase [bacterium]|nr:MAG: uracil-DNA glycosylase [bacterium]